MEIMAFHQQTYRVCTTLNTLTILAVAIFFTFLLKKIKSECLELC
jgi:hypothetical protein